LGTKTVIENQEYCEDEGSITRWSDRLSLLGGLKFVPKSLFKGWLSEGWCAPPLELYMVYIVQSMGEENGREVEV
jgi:hypothetical protein